jgi:hypothetical protein
MKYRKKPVVVEAVQFTHAMLWGEEDLPPGVIWKRTRAGEKMLERARHRIPVIETLEGTMEVKVGDYVIRGIKGEFYPCKPDIFEQTYEKVDSTS